MMFTRSPVRGQTQVAWNREQAKDSFLRAAASVADGEVASALVHASLGLIHLAASDPRERAKARALAIINTLKETA